MPLTAEDVSHNVLEEAGRLLDDCLAKIAHCLEQLSEDQVWWRPAESMNSIGNLVLHLTGNVRQWLVSGIGGAVDTRHRPAEFAERGPVPKATLLQGLRQVVDESKAAFRRTTASDMQRQRRIQGFDVTGWEALFHSVPHFNGHTQEIIGITRMQLGGGYKFHWKPATPEQGAP
jgi:uncharacterized damage-inducible protein DinB